MDMQLTGKFHVLMAHGGKMEDGTQWGKVLCLEGGIYEEDPKGDYIRVGRKTLWCSCTLDFIQQIKSCVVPGDFEIECVTKAVKTTKGGDGASLHLTKLVRPLKPSRQGPAEKIAAE